MKNLFIIIAIFLITLIGCTTTYKISDFASKDKFYNDFNKSVTQNGTKIELKNSDIHTSSGGIYIKNDTLFFDEIMSIGEDKVPLNRINKIEYDSTKILSGNIILNNNVKLYGEDIKILPDSSLKFIAYKKIFRKYSIDNIKEVSYPNHLLGGSIGFLTGSLSGFIIGLVVNATMEGKDSGNRGLYYFYTIQSLGAIVGVIWGWIDGYTYTYQFNP